MWAQFPDRGQALQALVAKARKAWVLGSHSALSLIWQIIISLIYARPGLGPGDTDESDTVPIQMGGVETLVGETDIEGGNFS